MTTVDEPISLCINCKNPTTFSKKTGKPNKFCSLRCVKHGEPKNILCSVCSIEFIATTRTQKTCSQKCTTFARRGNKSVQLTCSWCSKEMLRNSASIKEKNFCSQKCSHLSLRGGQEKIIEKECKNCKNKFELKYIDREQEFCSYHCSNSSEFSNFYGPDGVRRTGKPWSHGLTAETDERIAAAGKKVSATAKAQYAAGTRSIEGEKNPNFGKTVADRTPEQLENYSKAAIKRTLENKIPPGKNAKTGYFTSEKTCKKMYYRSSLELRTMKIFDKNNDVETYEHEPFSIQVRIGKRYLPDFLITYKNKLQAIVEVKPKFQLHDEDVILKQQAGEKYCEERGWKYQFYTLDDIIEYEKILNITI
jgi:hypothetical protein